MRNIVIEIKEREGILPPYYHDAVHRIMNTK